MIRANFKRFLSNSNGAGLKVGEELHGFKVTKNVPIKELSLNLIQLSHEKTGALYVHIDRDDTNHVFSVAFRTTPKDSTGVPHILEHTTLCGSKKYPVRDPFFKMLHRSLASYMNAWTSSDWTMYPFSSENAKDIDNLRSVYLDAVFNPLLRETDFKQEGWRIENEDLHDPNSKLVYKGVVYNEMKGAFSDSSSLFVTRAQQHLMKGTSYEHVSGGDPEFITDLTYQDLVKFHGDHYHPSNAMFYSYGNGYSFKNHLSTVNDLISSYEKRPPSTTLFDLKLIPLQGRAAILEKCQPDPVGDPHRQAKISLSFIANNPTELYESFALKLLSYLLIDGQSSPMFKALLDTNMGSEFTPNAGYDSSTLPASFSFGLQGINKNDYEKVEETILKVLNNTSQEKFDKGRIEAVLHQLELGMKNRTSSFGIGLAQKIVTDWSLQDPRTAMDLSKSLNTAALIQRLRMDMDTNEYLFNDLIKKYILTDRYLVSKMEPSDDYFEALSKKEQDKLSRQAQGLDLQEVYQEGLKLKEEQENKQDWSSLPLLKAEKDVPLNPKEYPLTFEAIDNHNLFLRRSKTNGITYLKSALVSDKLYSESDLRLMSIFTSLIPHLGTATKSPAEFEEEIRSTTGGISYSNLLSTSYNDMDQFQLGLSVEGYSLDRNLEKFYNLLLKSWLETNFTSNVPKIKTLLSSVSSSLSNSISDSGHRYAMKLASARVNPASKLNELQSGLTFIEYLSSLNDFEGVAIQLEGLHERMKNELSARYLCTCEETVDENKNLFSKFATNFGLKSTPTPLSKNSFLRNTKIFTGPNADHKVWLNLPFNTNFAAKCIRTVESSHYDSLKLQILAKLMSSHFLHKEIREKNGAYGGGCTYSSGCFHFYSYRDPNPLKSIETFQKSIEWARTGIFTEEELNEAKLSFLGQIDSPISAASEGANEFYNFITNDYQLKRRRQLLEMKTDDLDGIAEKYLFKQSSEVVLASMESKAPSGWINEKEKILF